MITILVIIGVGLGAFGVLSFVFLILSCFMQPSDSGDALEDIPSSWEEIDQ